MINKFTLRNLAKRPVLNLIKVVGLSLSLSGLIIIGVFLKNELSYDQYNKNSENLYRYTITNEGFAGGKHFARMPSASYIPQLAEYFPEIKNYVRLGRIRSSYIKNGDRFFKINQAFTVDSTFLDVFDIKLINGNSETILLEPASLIITEEYAQNIFGDENPIGKILSLPAGQFTSNDINYTVKGIMKKFPKTSHLHPDFITTPRNKNELEGWAWVYLHLNENANPNIVSEKFVQFAGDIFNVKEEDVRTKPHLQKVEDIHLHSHKLREIESNGNMVVVYTLAIAAFLLLFIAIVNYANLNVGMAVFSDKFLYINKVAGAKRKVNFKYFLSESILIALFTLILSMLVIQFLDKYLALNYSFPFIEGNKFFITLITGIFIGIIVLVGVLPVLNKSIGSINSFLNFTSENNFWKKGINKVLIVVQYTIAIALIVAVLAIQKQTNYAIKNSMGIGNDRIICFEDVHENVQKDFYLFKDELRHYASINTVSAMFEPPGGEANDMFQFELEGYKVDESNPTDNRIGVFPCDYDFIKSFNLNILSGTDFSENYEDVEGSGEYIINEAALKRLGYSNPDEIVGKEFALIFHNDFIKIPKGKIIAVVKDFHFSSLKNNIEPYVFFKRKGLWLSNIIISFNEENSQKALADIQTVWDKYFSNYPFQYQYLDAMYENVYSKEILQQRLLGIFTFISLFICSMGLLGLSLLITKQKTKEIGIRKVNGSTIGQIVVLLNWSLVKWILIAFVLSIPIAYYAVNKWLDNFIYRISLDWWLFAFAGAIAIFVSILTISLISWNAARNNPVKALRYE